MPPAGQHADRGRAAGRTCQCLQPGSPMSALATRTQLDRRRGRAACARSARAPAGLALGLGGGLRAHLGEAVGEVVADALELARARAGAGRGARRARCRPAGAGRRRSTAAPRSRSRRAICARSVRRAARSSTSGRTGAAAPPAIDSRNTICAPPPRCGQRTTGLYPHQPVYGAQRSHGYGRPVHRAAARHGARPLRRRSPSWARARAGAGSTSCAGGVRARRRDARAA